MIRVTDFRIGNIILQGGNITIIDSLERSINDWERTNHKRTMDTEPIPLTEKWLLEFGFILYSTGSLCKHLNNDDSYLAIDLKYGNGVWLNINQEGIENSIKLSHIKYVHELQNLFFALTGVELSVS